MTNLWMTLKMRYKIILHPLAKKDIKKSAIWYESKRTGLGKRFTTQIRIEVNYISKQPFSIVTKYNEIKTSTVKNFPFLIHFSIDNNKKEIIILGVFHTSLNPAKWKRLTS